MRARWNRAPMFVMVDTTLFDLKSHGDSVNPSHSWQRHANADASHSLPDASKHLPCKRLIQPFIQEGREAGRELELRGGVTPSRLTICAPMRSELCCKYSSC